jgi:hypothetical protein
MKKVARLGIFFSILLLCVFTCSIEYVSATHLKVVSNFHDIYLPLIAVSPRSFSFASLGDSQSGTGDLLKATLEIKNLKPNLVIFNGDLENSTGVTVSEMTSKLGVFKTAGLFDITMFVRGNHDNIISGSPNLWQTFVPLTYSKIYENSIFIGLDIPGPKIVISQDQYAFLDNNLTYAEGLGLTHAFVFFHSPEYCVESQHCTCQTRLANCTPQQFIDIINRHPIISAIFHGHEHILGWVHIDNTRILSNTHPYEEFFTSPAALNKSYYGDVYPNRIDYYSKGNEIVYADVIVQGSSFMINFYKVGLGLVWSKTFTK